MDLITGFLSLTLFVVSILPIPFYIFAKGGTRDNMRSGAVHTIFIAVVFGLLSAFNGSVYLIVFLVIANLLMGWLLYLAAHEVGLIKSKKETFNDYVNRRLDESKKGRETGAKRHK